MVFQSLGLFWVVDHGPTLFSLTGLMPFGLVTGPTTYGAERGLGCNQGVLNILPTYIKLKRKYIFHLQIIINFVLCIINYYF